MPGKGGLLLTGSLGDVMKESAQTALSYLRSQAKRSASIWPITASTTSTSTCPAGATPKDGPSAGVTIVAALASLLTRRRVRSDVAMTGEISLRGRVLRVGGIKEKVLAAARFGIKQVILPEQNRTDWSEVPEEVRAEAEGAFRPAHFGTAAADVASQMNFADCFRAQRAPAGRRRCRRLPCQPIILSPEAGRETGPRTRAQILSRRPAVDSTNTGVIRIRDRKTANHADSISHRDHRRRNELANSLYRLRSGKQHDATLRVVRPRELLINAVLLHRTLGRSGDRRTERKAFSGNETMVPFAGSDFWLADLGLEFLNWPTQRLLRKEIRRGQSCAVLESVNPHPAPGAYSRVVSWIDIETDGIINAEAYDSKGKLLKEFAVTSLKKVRGADGTQRNGDRESPDRLADDVGIRFARREVNVAHTGTTASQQDVPNLPLNFSASVSAADLSLSTANVVEPLPDISVASAPLARRNS